MQGPGYLNVINKDITTLLFCVLSLVLFWELVLIWMMYSCVVCTRGCGFKLARTKTLQLNKFGISGNRLLISTSIYEPQKITLATV